MRIFCTSDLHFNHANILEYCNRPFSSLEEMNAHIIKVWNDTVSETDIIYFLGDFAMGKKDHHLEFLLALKGLIKIVPGNHDHYLKKLAKRNQLPTNVEMLDPITNLKVGKQTFVLCHFPLEEWEGKAGHRSGWLEGTKQLHGHCHGKLGKQTAPDRWDVGWDVWGKLIELKEDFPCGL